MKYIKISSLQNKYIKFLFKLKYHKYRMYYKQALIEGWHLFEMANKNKIIIKIFILKKYINKIKNLLLDKNVVIITIQIMNKLSNYISQQGIIILISLKNIYDKQIDLNKNYLILENIQNPNNLGGLIRSSYAFNIENMLLVNNCVDIFNYKTINATQGALFNLKIKIINNNYLKIINMFKKNKYIIITTGLNQKKIPLEQYQFKLNNPFILCLGNESKGLSKQLLQLSDININITINNNLNSLNVVQAASIILYEINKQMIKYNQINKC